MTTYKIDIKPSAQKALGKLPKTIAGSLIKKIKGLANDPYPSGFKKLSGIDNAYRVRSGDYRVIYRIFNAVLVVEVIKIGHRKNVYKNNQPAHNALTSVNKTP